MSIGSNNGYYQIDLDAICETKSLIDHINLKEIFVNNNRSSLGPAINYEHLDLAHDQNTVLLKFSTNAHPYPHKLKYQYRLNSNENWSLPSSKPEIFLASLPTANYNIDVRVTDDSTGFNYTQPLLSLAILPPFWKTWWFTSVSYTHLTLPTKRIV